MASPTDTEPQAEPLPAPSVIHPIRMLKTKDYVTLLGTILGVLAIILVNDPIYGWLAGIFILMACGCDLLDGYIARRFKQINQIGGELDSLSDAIAFAVAPGLMLYFAYADFTKGTWSYGMLCIGTAFFICCGVLRLAWFNVTHYEGYVGLVVPLAAAFCVLYFWADVTFRALFVEIINPSDIAVAAKNFVRDFTPFFMIVIGIFMTAPFLVYDKTVKKKQGKTKYAIFFGFGVAVSSLVLGLILQENVRVYGLIMDYVMIGLLVYYIIIGFRNWLHLRRGKSAGNMPANAMS